MSATPSEEAMQIASAYIQHADTCDEQYQTTLKCVCAFVREKNDLASQIDALVASRVEEERERCALVAGHFGNMQQRQDEEGIIAATAAYAVRDAIRIPPPPLPSKEPR